MTHPSTPAAAVSLPRPLYFAAIDCGHVIEKNYVTLRFDETKPGHNALDQLGRRLDAAAATREAALIAERDQLRAMVEDVSKEIHALRAALVYIAEESDDMAALKCAQDALSAPAVGVE